MTEHDPGSVWREPGASEVDNKPALPAQPDAEVEATYLAKLQALLQEAEQDPDSFSGYEELGVVYQAARGIVLASRAGKPVTPPIPNFEPELAPLVHQLLLGRRDKFDIVRLPVFVEDATSQSGVRGEVASVSARIVDEFNLTQRLGEVGQEFYYSSFSWDKPPLPLPPPVAQ